MSRLRARRRLARNHRRRRRLDGRDGGTRARGGRVRRSAPVQQGQRRGGEDGHPPRERRLRADHRRRRPASARGRAADRRAARRVRPGDRRARAGTRRRHGRGAPATPLLNGLASYLTSRPIPDLTSGFRGARTECLREFIHLLPNGFSTPTTTTLAFIKAGYNVAFEPINARQRSGHSKIRFAQRRRAGSCSSCSRS